MTSRPSTIPDLRPEAELLICSAGLWSEDERINRIIYLLESEIDWAYLIKTADYNRVSTLLYWYLKKSNSPKVPRDVLDNLENEYDYTLKHNLLMAQELFRLLDLFEKKSIKVLPYRGPLLAFSLYKNPAFRQIWDLDILIKEENVLQAKELLLGNGYTSCFEMSPNDEEKKIKKIGEFQFQRNDDMIKIDLHWRILPTSMGDLSNPDLIWKSAVETTLAGNTLWTMSPDILVQVLLWHGGIKHQWLELKLITDIARIVEKYNDINWESILKQTIRTSSDCESLVGLHLANVLLGANLNPVISERIKKNSHVNSRAGLTIGRLFRVGFGLPGFSEWVGYVNSTGGWKDTPKFVNIFRYCRGIMTPEFDDKIFFPKWLRIMAYFKKYFRLIRRHGFRLLGRIR